MRAVSEVPKVYVTVKVEPEHLKSVQYLAAVGSEALELEAENLRFKAHKDAAVARNDTLLHHLAEFARALTEQGIPLSH
jgi:hypothetical protein